MRFPLVLLALTLLWGSVFFAGSRFVEAGVSHWTTGGPSVPAGTDVQALAFDPASPLTVYAGIASGGVFKTMDGGATWVAMNTGLGNADVRALAVDASVQPSVIYAGIHGGSAGGGVYKSINGGSSWTAMNTGLEDSFVNALAIDPVTPSTIYAGAEPFGFFGGGIFKSVNGGADWTNIGTPTHYIGSVAIDPTNSMIIYAGSPTLGGGLFKSTDGGVNWQSTAGLTNVHINVIAIDPGTPTTVYVGAPSGSIFKSTDAGNSWLKLNTGLLGPYPVNGLVIDPSNPARVYAGTSIFFGTFNRGVFRSTDGGNNWVPFDDGLTNTDVSSLVIDHSGTYLHAGTSGGVFDYQFAAAPTPTPSPTPTPAQRRPVIFIPGILGSQLDNVPPLFYSPNPLWPSLGNFLPGGTLFDHYLLDRRIEAAGLNIKATDAIRTFPIFGNIYEGFLGELRSNGYTEYSLGGDPNRLTSAGCDLNQGNPSLFIFPYDWRQSNSANAEKLKDYVGCIRRFYPDPNQKIDIVTHSMGGLLARSYLLRNSSDHHIGKLITIATPWLGAPKATRVLMTGEAFDRWLNLITRQSFKSLSEFFPSVHELTPTRFYFESVGAARPPYVLNGRALIYTEMISLLDTRFSSSLPGTANQSFHQISQDNWSDPNNPVNTSVEYHHLYGVKSIADTVGTVEEKNYITCPPGLPCFTYWTRFSVVPTTGDGTVPTLSALRTETLNAPGVSEDSGRIKRFSFDHVGSVNDNGVRNEVLQLLQAPAQTASETKTVREAARAISQPTIQPAYYLTVIGTTSASIEENSASSTNPLADPSDKNVPDITSYILGDQSFMAIMPVGQTYTINLRSGANPMILEVAEGTDTTTTRAIRYHDFAVPTGVNLRLQITSQGIEALRYDADADGTFEGTVVPGASVIGPVAQDKTPPFIEINATTQTNNSAITIASSDAGSGVRATYYSLNGMNFQPYVGPFVVNNYQAPIIYAFSDDNVGNRSALITHHIVAPGIPVLVTQPGSTRAIALDCVLWLPEPFHLTYDHLWGTDLRTRIMLFAMNFELAQGESASAVTATAQDGSNRIYPLTVEHVGKVPGSEWLTSVVVRLNDEMGDVGDVLVRITYHGNSSNAVRLGIGHVGGGPPDSAPARLGGPRIKSERAYRFFQ